MKSHEEKSTCASPRSFDQGDQENAHTGTAEAESPVAGGGEEKKVARKKHAPFQGGEVFSRLTVQSLSHLRVRIQYWRCLCECGNQTIVARQNLLSGIIKSCGCWKKEWASQHSYKHGEAGGKQSSQTPEYRCWRGMIGRCESPKTRHYEKYGGRGIKVCPRWRLSFEAFLEDMGRKPSSKHSLDRIDGDRDYELGNCRWATLKDQGRNKSNNVILTHEGYSATQAEWAERTGLLTTTICTRLKKGWTVADALTTPPRKKKPA